MSGFVGQIQDLKLQITISKIVGARVELVRLGQRMRGICPFHDESTPSFYVDDNDGFYHCFGCGAHGDVFDFIQQYEGHSSLIKAIRAVCSESGIEPPQSYAAPIASEQPQQTELFEVMEAFVTWCSVQLNSSIGGAMALEYLAKRGVKIKSVAHFRIGYCPEDSASIAAFIKKYSISREAMNTLGLIVDNRPIFGGRLIFPIFNSNGKAIAVGARSLGAKMPKYINSKEHLIFKKNEHLYATHLAFARRTEEVIVVEGYLDAIMLYQSGAKHVVASMGTAFSDKQLLELWKRTPHVCICFDGDAAGKAAMDKIAMFAVANIDTTDKKLSFINLPENTDPAEEARQRGLICLSYRTDLSERVFNAVSRTADMTLPGDRATIETRLMSIADKISNKALSKHYKQYFRNKLYERKNVALKSKVATYIEKLSDKVCMLQIALTMVDPSILAQPGVEEDFAFVESSDQQLLDIKDFIIELFHNKPSLQFPELLVHLEGAFSKTVLAHVVGVARMMRDSAGSSTVKHFAKITMLWRELVSYEDELNYVDDAVRMVAKKRVNALKEIRNLMYEITG